MTIHGTEPSLRDFEAGAIGERGKDSLLRRITSQDGKRVLWTLTDGLVESSSSQDGDLTIPEPQPVEESNPGKATTIDSQMVNAMRQARTDGASTPEIAKQFNVSPSTVKRRAPATSAQSLTNNANITTTHSVNLDFPGTENQLPYSVRMAIHLSMDTAAQNAILSEDRQVKSYFEGYLAGYANALAIICGSGRVDLSFLEDRNNDTGISNTEQ